MAVNSIAWTACSASSVASAACSSPFDEFDPVLQLLPSGYGSHDYALWLHHRYTDNKVCLATRVHSLGLDKVNALAFWDCLQRYMDVTQPLPDLPVLEPSRPLIRSPPSMIGIPDAIPITGASAPTRAGQPRSARSWTDACMSIPGNSSPASSGRASIPG